MDGYYDYQRDLCKCNEPQVTPSPEGVYDYMADICVCDPGIVTVCMRDLLSNETTSYPVNVYNVNEEFIGLATTKSQYRIIWNSDAANQLVGILVNGPGPFCFSLELNAGQASPGYVIGDPTGGGSEVDEGIYAKQYEDQYE